VRSFASDNHSGVHPLVMDALQAANADHVVAYGDDPWTARAEAVLKAHFGAECQPFFVFLGTAANVLSLRAMADSYHSVLCSDFAHIHRDECGAPERLAGMKLMPVTSHHGKIAPDDLAHFLADKGFVHHSQPRVVSITQATELGTVYTPGEVRALADFCHANDMLLHMDGARLCNAAAHLGIGLTELTKDAGVDVLSLGGTKNGLMYGEAVIVFRPELAAALPYLRKQNMQLASKMRFIAAQFEALFSGDLWLDNARQANAMAKKLADAVGGLPAVELTRPVETNAVFATLPAAAADRAREHYPFYTWDAQRGEVRWMTSFDTTEADVEAFAAALREAL
jgi:threonine aldolase